MGDLMLRLSIPLLLVSIGVSLLASSAGCSSPRLKTPNSFVELEDPGYGNLTYKAISSDGAMLVVRWEDDQPKGDVNFWTEALTRELTGGRGYELLETVELRSSLGGGKLVHLRGTLGDEVYRYDVAIFVHGDDEVVTVEAAAPEAQYEGYSKPFTDAIESLYFD